MTIRDLPGDQDPHDYAPIVAEQDPFLRLAHTHTVAAMPSIGRRSIASEVRVEISGMRGR